MKQLRSLRHVLAVAAIVVTAASQASAAHPRSIWGAVGDRWAMRTARTRPWHNDDYYHTAWGTPVALVVPPTAHMQTRMGWGVTQNEMTPIYHQFRRPYPGEFGGDASQFRPTPYWPSHTDQFGIYPVRGPW